MALCCLVHCDVADLSIFNCVWPCAVLHPFFPFLSQISLSSLLPHSHLSSSNKRTADSRAYLNFTEPTKVLEFKAKFHGHVFVSARGTQH
eukprot:evm.model.scf_3065.1 EVM.evm.TU.scf_3065.1   scf_3065:585-1001(-)